MRSHKLVALTYTTNLLTWKKGYSTLPPGHCGQALTTLEDILDQIWPKSFIIICYRFFILSFRSWMELKNLKSMISPYKNSKNNKVDQECWSMLCLP